MSSDASKIQRIRNLIQSGQLDVARAECVKLLRETKAEPHIWQLAADIAMRTGAKTEALQYLERALTYAPGNTELLIQLGQYLLSMGRRMECRARALEAAGGPVDRPAHLDALGTLLTHCGDPDLALPLFERAVGSAPKELLFRYNLAMAERMVGNLKAAEANLDIVLAATPEDGEAQNARSGLRTQTCAHNHVLELQSVLARVRGLSASVPVEFALAKELEDLGEFRQSFAHLASACRSVRASIRYDVGDDTAVLDALAREHTFERLAPLASSIEADQSVFIIGLPRSGTTLVERILGSHSQVSSGGELDFFPKAIIEAVTRSEGRPPAKLDFVEATLKLNFHEIGATYLAATRDCIGTVHRLTDKLPFNYLYAGLIHTALPRAKFIAVHRNPVDVCYAMYKTLFSSAYPFSYDLLDLARYYVSWHRLMRHWAQTIGSTWLTLNYEDLVSHQEEFTRILLAHCGLEWEPACLDFHKSSQPVTTASAAQVRRPLYSDSVGRWRVYDKELAPLIRYLGSHGVACQEA
jgi:tetratricopeptide (TPR) repeat protein